MSSSNPDHTAGKGFAKPNANLWAAFWWLGDDQVVRQLTVWVI